MFPLGYIMLEWILHKIISNWIATDCWRKVCSDELYYRPAVLKIFSSYPADQMYFIAAKFQNMKTI